MTRYEYRHGKRIAIETLPNSPKVVAGRRKQEERRKPFEPLWVKLPRYWFTALLNSNSANTYRLAHLILWEAFKRKYTKGEIVLSTQVTKGISHSSRIRAAEELSELGLIQIVRRDKRRALVVTINGRG